MIGRHICTYLLLTLGIAIAKETYYLTPAEVYAALYWPVIYLALYIILAWIEDEG